MDPITQQVVLATAGAAGAGEATYVDDVFSTFLYEGVPGSGTTVNNGIDLSGEGGMVWVKNRDSTSNQLIYDTERGAGKSLYAHSSVSESTDTDGPSSFLSNGFTTGSSPSANHVSWTFRKAPGFFDVVTWSGNNVDGRNISHSLGSTPGLILFKPVNSGGGWYVHHRSLGFSNSLLLNSNSNASFGAACTATSSTTMTVQSTVNATGTNYVAYVFAHDDQSFGTDEDEAIIKCGSYSGTGSSGNHVNVGFEPQWLLIKNSSTSNTNWAMFDVMRGLPAASGGTAVRLDANLADKEGLNNAVEPSPTGFTPTGAGSYTNASGATFVYMAIRRPHKPPTTGTDVFNATTYTGNQTSRVVGGSSNLTDLAFLIDRDATSTAYSTYGHYALTRLHGSKTLSTASYNQQVVGWADYFEFDVNKGLKLGAYDYQNDTGTDYVLHTFTRAPGFFDVVAYEGNGTSGRTLNHNLTAVPEMMIVKNRTGSGNWQVYHSSQGNTKYSPSFNTDPFYTSSNRWNNTTPTSTQFTLGADTDVNGSSSTYFAYLFATLDGISKVGSYSGTGSAQNIDCGFTNGARFVLIKRADTETQGSAPSRTNWYVWDSTRGIVSGNDPWIALNETSAEVTNTDYIDPLNAGFTVSSTGSGLNASGGTYIFLAIA